MNWTEHLQTKSEWNWKKTHFFRICSMLILVYYSHIDDGKKMVKYSRHHWYTTKLCRRGIKIQLVLEHIQTKFVCVCCVILYMNVETSRASHAIAMYSMIVYTHTFAALYLLSMRKKWFSGASKMHNEKQTEKNMQSMEYNEIKKKKYQKMMKFHWKI